MSSNVRMSHRFVAGSVAAGAVVLAALGSTAAFAAEGHGGGDVNVDVQIAPITQPGVLAMSLAGNGTTLTESGSTALVRQFTGTLPQVTVTDTRTAEEIPDGAAWYVLGTATDFTGDAGQAPISAGHLGWNPTLIDGSASGLVAEGDEVVTVLDTPTMPGNNVGLVDQELLAMTADSAGVAAEGQWTANAQLFLRTDPAVAPGAYASVVTISLFE